MERKPIIVKGEIIEMSFDEVYKQFERLAYSIVYKMCEFDDDRDDVIQIALIGMWHSYKTYEISKGVAFTTYATLLIKHRIMMYWRTKKKKRVKTVSLNSEMLNSEKSDTFMLQNIIPALLPDVDAIIDTRKILDEMDCQKREVLLMWYNGYSQHAIGRFYGVSQPQASQLCKKAKEQFKQLYAQ